MKVVRIVSWIICIIVLYFAIDLICIFTINKPLIPIKGSNPYQYLGLFYDVYNCPEHTIPHIKSKQSKYMCSKEVLEVEKIIDTTKGIKDFACAEALEEFYQDENYKYYYNCIKSDYIIVKYSNGYEETVKEALKNQNIKIEDLDTFDINYLKYEKEDYFARTYNVLNVTYSNDENYLYLTIRQFQFEEVETVKVKRTLASDVVENKNYEFTFKYLDKELKDNLKSIFDNTELISIIETDKVGLEQVQDALKNYSGNEE